MKNLLLRFYFFSKLTTSLILLFTLLFLGYLFIKAYLLDTENSNVVSQLTGELKVLSNSIEKNSINLKQIEEITIKYENSFNEFRSTLNNLQQNEPNEELLIQTKKLFKENELLKIEMINLSKKIHLLNNQSQQLEKNTEKIFPTHNLLDLIILKLESGVSVNDEIQLLQNFDYSEDKISYLEKLQILSNKNFIGLKKLNKIFEKNSSEYLNAYYLESKNNSFIKYLSNIIIIQPNFDGVIEDENVRLLSKARAKIYEKDLEGALNNLVLITDSEIFFKKWINEVNYLIEFEKTLNELFK